MMTRMRTAVERLLKSVGLCAESFATPQDYFSAPNSVSTGINKKPLSTTQGDGPITGEEVQIAVARLFRMELGVVR